MPLYGEIERSKYAVIDIETKDGDTQNKGFTRPFMAGYYDGRIYCEFKGPDCLPKILALALTEANDGMAFYAHNGGGFDWLHMLPFIKALGYHMSIMAVAGTIQMLTVKRRGDSHRKGWRFLDSFKLIPISLASACRAFGGLEKIEYDLDTHESDPLWSEYLERDCVALYDVLEKFHTLVEVRLGGEVGITAASTAMKTFRRGYQTGPIERNCEHHALAREAYYGGRVEIFASEGENLKCYDINSSYPWAMTHHMPTGKATTWEGYPPAIIRQGRIGFARARVMVPDSVRVPVLCVRCPETGKLLFPTGKLVGSWTVIELEAAQKQGAVIEWLESVWFEAKPVFAKMVKTLYSYRNKGLAGYDEGLSQVSKIMLNSLYGKFAMNPERENMIVLLDGETPPENGRSAAPKDPNCSVWYIKETVDAVYIIPQISAYITALSRLHLHRFLTIADENGKLAYCDTDSIITDADLSEACSTELGGLKDEGKGIEYSGVFVQPKLYCLLGSDGSHKLAMKGYKDRTPTGFKALQDGGVASFQALEKLGAMGRKSFSEGPKMRTVTRRILNSEPKRENLPDGSTKPRKLTMY